MANFPIVRKSDTGGPDFVAVSPHGQYGFRRTGPSDGACGYSGQYPCTHWGVDLTAPKGTPVLAPESGVLVEVANGASAPWRGYGPGLAVILGSSGAWHLLAHLDPEVIARWQQMGPLDSRPKTYPLAERVTEGQLIGYVSAANHAHWEVRKARTGAPATNTRNPGDWLREQGSPWDPSWVHQVTTAPTGVRPAGQSDDGLALLIALGLWLWDGRRR